MKIRNKEYIFFDLNGTLCDIDYSKRMAINAVYEAIKEKYSYVRKRDVIKYFDQASKRIEDIDSNTEWHRKMKLGTVLRELEIDDDDALESRVIKVYGKTRFEHLRLNYGAISVLKNLRYKKGKKLGIISNGPAKLQLSVMGNLGIKKYFSKNLIVISSNVHHRKPSREIFELAIARAGGDKSKVLYVGNSQKYDLPAQKYMDTIWYNPGWEIRNLLRIPRPKATIRSLEKLLDIVP